MPAAFEIDKHKARNANCWSLLSILSLATELAHQERLDKEWFEKAMHPFSVGANDLFEYLLKNRPIRLGNPAATKFVEFILHITCQLEKGSSFRGAGAGSYPDIFSRLHLLTSPQQEMTPAQRVAELVACRSIEDLVYKVCNTVAAVPHPRLPCLAFSNKSVKAHLRGLVPPTPKTLPNLGVFFVVREARGHSAQLEHDRNIIVRDVCWMPAPGPESKQGEDWHGYYFSAFENTVYQFSSIQPTDKGTIVAEGTILPWPGRHQAAFHTIRMDFRPKRNDFELQLREVLLTGETRTMDRPAAWKALMIRPDWPTAPIEQELATIDDPFKALGYLQKCRYLGILYRRYGSEAAAVRAAQPQRTGGRRLEATEAKLISRREAFHRLLSPTAIETAFTLPPEDRKSLEKEFINLAASTQPAPDFARRMVGKVEEVVNKYWIYVEPTQVILRRTEDNPARTEDIPPDVRELTRRLLTREGILLYDDVKGKVPSSQPLLRRR